MIVLSVELALEGVILIPPSGNPIPLSYWLNFPCKNNTIEYEALIFGICATLSFIVQDIFYSMIPN